MRRAERVSPQCPAQRVLQVWILTAGYCTVHRAGLGRASNEARSYLELTQRKTRRWSHLKIPFFGCLDGPSLGVPGTFRLPLGICSLRPSPRGSSMCSIFQCIPHWSFWFSKVQLEKVGAKQIFNFLEVPQK